MDKKKESIILEYEEKIARLRLNIASAKRERISLQNRLEEVDASFPQWDEEIAKIEKNIKQIGESK